VKVVINGAGIAGLALAGQLATHGADITILEKAPRPRAGGYMIDFFGPGYDAAEAMGVLPRVLDLGYHIDEVVYCDEAGRRRAGLRFAQLTRATGGRVTSVLRPDLELALREHLPASVDLRYGTTVTSITNHPDGVDVCLDNAGTVTTVSADLLVGCDGVHSATRALAFGPEPQYLRYLGFHTAAFTFADPAAHAEIGGRFCMTDTVHRTMGFYGLRDGRVAVFAVHPAADPALPADPRAALRHAYSGLGWIAPRAMAACPPAQQIYYDQVAQVDMPSWTRGRVTLLGDAAYAVSLLAGQGAALAVAGAYVLAEHLAGNTSLDTALQAYERALRPVVQDKQLTARKTARWFVPSTTTGLHIRHIFMAAARLPVADRLVAAALIGKPTTVITDLTGPDTRTTQPVDGS
jgi:2-polyprenyl-6-methoxyphenol hydroxylase-like FAD-dependent oxidoreductase